MKTILSLMLGTLILFFQPTYGDDFSLEVPVIKIIDGDTFKTIITFPPPLHDVSIRIYPIDAPETSWRAKCPEEKKLGLQAKSYLTELLKDAKIVSLTNLKWDEYGGRIDATVYYNGVNIGQRMIDKGYAKKYTGKEKKPEWCNQ